MSTSLTGGKYLVCVDGSDASRVALHFACKRAAKRGGLVELLHVILPSDMQNMFGVLDVARDEQRRDAEALVHGLVESARAYCGVAPFIKLREGRLGDEVIGAVMEDPEIDMLLLGATPESSGRGKFIHWLSGQLGDKLMLPMLLVPGNLTDLQIEALT